jgi:hypothetical protein
VTVDYDGDGRPLEYTLNGPEGRYEQDGVSRYRFTYDRQGNRTSEEYLNDKDNPVPGPSGYARAAYRFDAGGNLLASKFYDKDGEAVTMRVVVVPRDAAAPPPPAPPEGPPVPLEPGDVLLTYGGQVIVSTLQLHDMKRREDPGREPRPMEVMRDGVKVKLMLPSGLPGGDPFGEFRRRNGRAGAASPFWFIRSLAGQGPTPPLVIGDAILRMEVAP